MGSYPWRVTVVSFGFKKQRFAELHRAALRFPNARRGRNSQVFHSNWANDEPFSAGFPLRPRRLKVLFAVRFAFVGIQPPANSRFDVTRAEEGERRPAASFWSG